MMTSSRSNYHLNVLLGLLVIVLVGSSATASVINGRKNDDFEANSMLRDSSSKGVLNNAQQQHNQHRTVLAAAAAVGQDNGEDDSSSPSVLMMMNDGGGGGGGGSGGGGSGGGGGVRNGDGGGSSGISGKSSSYAGRDVGVVQRDNTDSVVRQDDEEDIILLPLNDQVRLLTKQLNALTIRRREDYELLENNLRKSLRITNNADDVDMSIRAELDQLRHEMKALRENHIGGNKEKLTVEWISQTMAEIRKELAEVQEIASKASKDVSQRTQNFEDLATIKSDFHLFKLELEALKDRQQTTEVFVKELREDAMQRESDFRKLLKMMNQVPSKETNADSNPIQLSIESEADHKRRHHRFQRQQLHDLEIAQRDVKRQLNELKYHRIGERVRNLEIEQHRIAGANFNLSRQIASLDKLHSSMLELLEDVEGIHNKMDKTLPDVRREISKLEFTTAQLNSEQSLVREEGQNVARSVQAMAVSVSALQEERDTIKDMQIQVDTLRKDVERLQSITEVQKSIVHRRIEKMENEAKRKAMLALDLHGVNKVDASTVMADDSVNSDSRPGGVENIEMAAQNLVEKLESVELQYESIINKLPNDCSRVEAAATTSGLYLIAPAGQHKPTMAHCSEGWTTIQRRFDGSVDFNRSWEAYASGFGTPAAEFWIGNDMLHHLTADNCTELKIVMQDIYDNTWYAQYKNFYISPREDGYRLHISGYSGNASDALDYQNAMQFSAIDVDRDISNTHCAANYEGGWWFSHCQHANLNGRYNLGLTWFDASRNEWIAVKSSQMLITKRQSCTVDTVDRRSNSHQSYDDKLPENQVKATPKSSQQATNVATGSTSRTDGDGNSLTIANGERVAFINPSIVADAPNVKLTKVRTTTTIASVV